MSVHEHGVAASTVETKRLVVRPAVELDPGTTRRTTIGRRVVVDDFEARVPVLGPRGTGHAVAGGWLGPAPGISEARARWQQFEPHGVGELQCRERLAAPHAFHEGNG